MSRHQPAPPAPGATAPLRDRTDIVAPAPPASEPGATPQAPRRLRILLVAEHTFLVGEPGYNRFRYVCELLASDHDVTLVTSRFNHFTKSFRPSGAGSTTPYAVVLMDSSPYTRNLSLGRLRSQRHFARSVYQYASQMQVPPDIIYFSIPTFGSLLKLRRHIKQHDIQCIIDVQDLWPEAMRLLVPIPWLSRLLFLPMQLQASTCYRAADKIIAVSQEYLDRAMRDNTRAVASAAVYIGTSLSEFDQGTRDYAARVVKPSAEFWAVYIGTLGASYDIDTLIRATLELSRQGVPGIRLKILGRGPDRSRLQALAQTLGAPVDFIDYLPYPEMAAYLSHCDVGVNALRRNSAGSIINKVGDYFSAGLPVANGSMCAEMRQLITDYDCGINYTPEDIDSLVSALKIHAEDITLRRRQGINARRLAEEKFAREHTYEAIRRLVIGDALVHA